MQQEQPSTFRFKFTPEFAEQLNVFARLHRFDNRHDFKEAWTKWTNEHALLIEKETKFLESNGYIGSVIDKMYKSARYYFAKKKGDKPEPKKRRRYVNVTNEIINLMDDHIAEYCCRKDFKPRTAFSNFCESNKEKLETEVMRLYAQENLPEEDIPIKIKKTYNNRYFQRVKAPLLASTSASATVTPLTLTTL